MRTLAVSSLVFLSAAPALLPGQNLEGVWRGGIEDRGQNLIEFELQIGPRAALPAGRLQALGRGVANPFVVDVAALGSDNAVRIEIQTLRVVIEGHLAQDGQVIDATWTQFGEDRQELRLTRAQHASAPAWFDPLVEIRIPKAPTAVRSQGDYRLYYEIHIANFTEEKLDVASVEILLGEQTATLAGEALAQQGISYGTAIPPNKGGGIMVGLRMSSAPPRELGHRVTFRVKGQVTTLETQAVPVSHNAVRISPPLGGGNWWAGNGPDSSRHHRAAIIPMDGRFTIAQRFAFDFSRRVAASTAFERGDPRQLASSPSFGAEVLAVSDGTVSLVRDNLPDALPYEIAPPYAITKQTVGGNLVVLDLGGGRWAVYAHLQAGSIRVQPGARVRRGDVIARLGNSASYSPHLHFHVVDGPDPFSSEGVPFVFDEFTHEGKVYRDEMPAGGWTIGFAEKPSARRQ